MASARTTYTVGRAADGAAPAGPAFVWVSLHEPSPDELASVQREFGLPERLVDYLSMGAKRPILEDYGDVLFAVVKTATWVEAEEAVRLGEVRLVLGERFVVSVDRDAGVLAQVRQDLEADPELAGIGPAAVLPSVVKHAVEGYLPVLLALNNVVEEVEEAVFSPTGPRPTERIYKLSREVLEFRRATLPLREILDRLATEPPSAGDRLKRRFREERSHLAHLVEAAEGLSNLLSNVLQANLTEVSVRQNDDMRKISAWVAIWAIPTLIAGIYGMNFKHMPELDWTWGYPLALVAMVAICLLVYRGFRRSGWL